MAKTIYEKRYANLTKFVDVLEDNGIEISEFTGDQIVTKDGRIITMFDGEIFIEAVEQ